MLLSSLTSMEASFPAEDGKQVPPAQQWEGNLIPAARWRLSCGIKVASHPLPFLLVMRGEYR